MAPEKNQDEHFNPFPGLRPFRPEEVKYFFGRDNESKEIAGKLLKNRFVAILGASGSGKSSLIQCGLLPQLEKVSPRNLSPWIVLPIRPGNDPLGSLSTAFVESRLNTAPKKPDNGQILKMLRESPEGISRVLEFYKADKGKRVLLIIDQFEELFRYGSPETGVGSVKDTAIFLNLLTQAVSPANPDFYVVISLRSDMISECSHYKSFTNLVNNSNFLVPRMTRESIREAIEGPVRNAGAGIDAELTDQLVNECSSRADQLPVLQHALMKTWERWKELDDPGKTIDFSDYSSVDSMDEIISADADEAYEKLSPDGKIICEKLFKSITGKGSDGKGIRYPSNLGTIRTLAQCSGEELAEVIDKFRDPSLSVLTPEPGVILTDDSIIDLSHESIIHLWERLRKWVEDEASSVAIYLALSEASALYQQGKAGLLRQPDLQLAINWRDQQKPSLTWARKYDPAFERAMVYLRTSEKEFLETEERKIRQQKWRFRRIRIISSILGILVILTGLSMVTAFLMKASSDSRRREAEKQKNEVIAENTATRNFAALAVKKSIEADSAALVAGFKEQEEKRLRLITEEQLAKAEQVAKESRKVTQLAQSDAKTATEKNAELQRLRMISIAKSMSLRSLQMSDQTDLQALLAYQAWIFNKNFSGPRNDADIYMGLYNVEKQNKGPVYGTFAGGHQGSIRSIAFARDKNEFYTAGSDGKVLKWDLNGGPQAFRMIYSDSEITDILAVSPSSDWLACGKENSTIRLIPLKGTDESFDLKGHTGKIRSLVFSFDGKFLYSAALDGKVLKWDLSAKTSTNISTGEIEVTSIVISSMGQYIAGVTPAGRALVWNPDNASDRFTIESQGKAIRSIRFRPDKAIFAVGYDDGTLEIWDAATRQKMTGIKAHSGSVYDIRFNAYHPQMATSGTDGTMKLWDTNDLTSIPVTFDDNGGPLVVFEFNPDGTMIISAAGNEQPEIIRRPAYADTFAADGCKYVTRNFTPEEWQAYVGRDIEYEKTCPGVDLKIKIRELR